MELFIGFAIIVGLGALMLILYAKWRYYPLVAIVYVFALILNVQSLSTSLPLPLTPYLQIFLLLFETAIFLMASIDYAKASKESGRGFDF